MVDAGPEPTYEEKMRVIPLGEGVTNVDDAQAFAG